MPTLLYRCTHIHMYPQTCNVDAHARTLTHKREHTRTHTIQQYLALLHVVHVPVQLCTWHVLTLDFSSSGRFIAQQIAVLFCWHTQQRSDIGFMMTMLGRSCRQSSREGGVCNSPHGVSSCSLEIQGVFGCARGKKLNICVLVTRDASSGICICSTSLSCVCEVHVHVHEHVYVIPLTFSFSLSLSWSLTHTHSLYFSLSLSTHTFPLILSPSDTHTHILPSTCTHRHSSWRTAQFP